MKEDINLLPPLVKEAQINLLHMRQAGRLLTAAILWLAVEMIIVGSAYAVARQVDEENLSGKDISLSIDPQVASSVREANAVIKDVHSWTKRSRPVTDDLADVVDAVPAGVTLSYLGYDGDANSLMIKGNSASRDSLVALQRRLEEFAWSEKVEAPLSNFATGTSQSFTFTVWRKK